MVHKINQEKNPEQANSTNNKAINDKSSQISSDSLSIVSNENYVKPLPFQKHIISYLMLILSCFAWVTGFIYANQNKMSPFETTISRYTIMFFVTYIHCRIDGSSMIFFNRPHQKTLIFRNIVISLHGFVVAIMQFYLPLGIFHTLVISGQIFIFLANYFLKGIKITTNQVIGVAISFIGLGLVINGRFISDLFTHQNKDFQTDFSNYFATDIQTQIQMGFLYVAWNALWAVSVVLTKMPQYSAAEILFTQSTYAICFAGIGYLIFDSDSHVPLQTYLPSIVFCGIIMIANYLFTYGVMWSANTGISTMMLMFSAVFGYFISIYRYNEQLNIVSFIGTIILVISAGYVVYQQQKLKS